MQDIVKKFGRKIKEIRLEKKMSQCDVAKILCVHPTYISSLERGQRNPSLLSIKKFANAFGIKLSEIFNNFEY